jgi:hypothetical protein
MANKMSTSELHLERFPAEIICNIFSQLDLEGALDLAKSSIIFASIFRKNWSAILLPILEREFSPLDSLLQIAEPFRHDFSTPGGMWLKRRVYFHGRLVCEEDRKGLLGPINYRQEHMKSLIRMCKAVKGWEAIFPRLRFAQRTQFARSLHEHENERLRSALYNWWRYAIYFHQDLEQSKLGARDPRRLDIGCNNLRRFSTAQLYELQDLWETVKCAVATEVCPSTPLVLKNAVSIGREKLPRS